MLTRGETFARKKKTMSNTKTQTPVSFAPFARSLKTKADLNRFVAAVEKAGLSFTSEQLHVWQALTEVHASVAELHGRSTEARQATKECDDLRRQVLRLGDERKTEAKAPTKAGKTAAPKAEKPRAKKAPLTEEEKAVKEAAKAEKKLARLREKAEALYGSESAVEERNCCLCGCGQEAPHVELKNGEKRYKLFVQGHDAKLKGKAKLVSAGLLPRRVLTSHAEFYLSRWEHVSDETLEGLGLERQTWDTDEGERPKSWELFEALYQEG